jgi:hypothetical protein
MESASVKQGEVTVTWLLPIIKKRTQSSGNDMCLISAVGVCQCER